MINANDGHACAALDAVDVRGAGGPGSRMRRALTAEPWWLRGLSWRLVGMAAALVLVFSTAIGAEWIDPPDDGFSDGSAKALVVLCFNAIAGLAILLIATVLSNLRRPRLPLPWILCIAVVAGPLAGHLFMVVQNFDDRPPFLSTPSGTAIFVLVRALLIMLPWGLAAAAWYFSRRAALRASELRAAELDRRRLAAGVIEARLRALQAQVEPHFLFNTLAHIKRLYRTDPARARRMLDSFRAYLRSALPQIRAPDATLGRELDLARAYLGVQEVRMGRRLQVSFDAPNALCSHPFPSMMLISLVENAIKHGLNPLPQGGTISIVARQMGDTVCVTVSDTGLGIDDQLGSGVGLSNIRERLAALFGSAGRLSLASRSPQGVAATIEIPRVGGTAVAGADPTASDRPHRQAA
jgi:signal transduction histidine kinase